MNEFSSASEPEEEDQSSENELSDDDFLAVAVVAVAANEFIKPPDYIEVQPLIIEHSYKYRPWFDNVLAACLFDMKFTYMLAGYEGSCHDARMLEEAIAFHGFPIPPPSKIICYMI
ncbi:hypothetical protein TIFTF001_033020 [Ficus carica]|uniref:DDE Tnp4 domain-containing protein n=1 Tax=Ficus carica TaxID=3494 RepID=A0AA88J7E7_FICCA|nr:hypothetical protein TIFTF001_033020 [Ficus carica]